MKLYSGDVSRALNMWVLLVPLLCKYVSWPTLRAFIFKKPFFLWYRAPAHSHYSQANPTGLEPGIALLFQRGVLYSVLQCGCNRNRQNKFDYLDQHNILTTLFRSATRNRLHKSFGLESSFLIDNEYRRTETNTKFYTWTISMSV